MADRRSGSERRTEHPIRDLLAEFDRLYQQHSGSRYPFNGGRDSKMMKDLLVMYSEPEIRSFMAAFFEMDDPFIEQSGHSLGVFRGCLPKIIRHLNGATKRPAMSRGAAAIFRVIGGKDEPAA